MSTAHFWSGQLRGELAVQHVVGHRAACVAIGGARHELPLGFGRGSRSCASRLATVFSQTFSPAALSAWQTRGLPYTPRLCSWTALIFTANSSRRSAATLSRPNLPGVIPRAADPQRLARQVNGKPRKMFFDEGELHVCSLAKNAAAFFKISRSISSRAFSLRRRRNSAVDRSFSLGRRTRFIRELA